jgi:hypothetical protein
MANWEVALLIEAERGLDMADRSSLVSLLTGDWKLPIWKPLGTEGFWKPPMPTPSMDCIKKSRSYLHEAMNETFEVKEVKTHLNPIPDVCIEFNLEALDAFVAGDARVD